MITTKTTQNSLYDVPPIFTRVFIPLKRGHNPLIKFTPPPQKPPDPNHRLRAVSLAYFCRGIENTNPSEFLT